MYANHISKKFLKNIQYLKCWLIKFYQLVIEFKVVKIENKNKKYQIIIHILIKSWILIKKHRKSHIK